MKSNPGWTVLLLLAGCSAPLEPAFKGVASTSSESVSPTPLSPGSNPFFFPLELGNRWQYHRVFRISTSLYPELPPIETRSRIESFMSCVEPGTIGYVVEHRIQTDTTLFGPSVAHQWIRYRQDMHGLYEQDVSIAEPASCEQSATEQPRPSVTEVGEDWLIAELTRSLHNSSTTRALDPARIRRAAATISRRLALLESARGSSAPTMAGGALPGELTRLEYPLLAGSTWNVREIPWVVTSTVVGHEHLNLPLGKVPAYRVDMDIPTVLGPTDWLTNWYGRAGWLGEELHFELATDVGLLIIDETIVLEDVSLTHGRF